MELSDAEPLWESDSGVLGLAMRIIEEITWHELS
jgi:hypothetical protein